MDQLGMDSRGEVISAPVKAASEMLVTTLSIVVPCYNEQEVLGETAKRLLILLGDLAEHGKITKLSRVYFVDDGSSDQTWAIVESLVAQDERIIGIKLSRNQGHQNALLAGLFTALGDAVVTIDADLQDDVNVIKEMVEEFRRGTDIVYGVRKARGEDGAFKRASAQLFYRLMHAMGAESIYNHADFRLMSRRAIHGLGGFREVNLFLRGIVPLIGLRSANVYYDRTERFAGTSKYPFWKMVAFAVEGITSFSVVPLRLITLTGFIVFLLTCLLSAWVLWARFFTDRALPGWASTVLPLYFVSGVQILCLGVIGEYVGKIYNEVKARPRYMIDRVIGHENQRP